MPHSPHQSTPPRAKAAIVALCAACLLAAPSHGLFAAPAAPSASPTAKQTSRPAGKPASKQAPPTAGKPASKKAPPTAGKPAPKQAPPTAAKPASKQAPRPAGKPASKPHPHPTSASSRGRAKPDLLTQDGHCGLVTGLSFDASGKRLASVAIDGSARLWDVASGRVLATFDLEYHCFALALSPDGRTLVTGGPDGRLDVWDTNQARLRQTLAGRRCDVRALSFSPDGRRLAVADTAAVSIWNLAESRVLISFERNRERITSLAWSPDGKWLAIRSNRGTALWAPQGTKAPRTLSSPQGGDAGFADEGRLLLAGTAVCEAETGTVLLSPRMDSPTRFSCIAPDGKSMVLVSESRVVTLSIPSGAVLASQECDGASAVAMAPDGRTVALAPLLPVGRIQLVDARTPREGRILEGRAERPSSAIFAQGGRTLVVRSLEGTVIAWNLLTGHPSAPLGQADGLLGVPGLPLDAAGDVLAIAHPNRVELWNLATMQQVATVEGSAFQALALTPDGKHLLTGEAQGRVVLWDADGHQVAVLKPASHNSVMAITSRPDGKTVALASGTAVEEWDLESRKLVVRHPLGDLAASAVSVAYSPDGRRLATVSRDGTLRLLQARVDTAPEALHESRGTPPLRAGLQPRRHPHCARRPGQGRHCGCPPAQGRHHPRRCPRHVLLPGLHSRRQATRLSRGRHGLRSPLLGREPWQAPRVPRGTGRGKGVAGRLSGRHL